MVEVRYDPHAAFQIERRGIEVEWIEAALREPDDKETRGDKLSFLRRLVGRAEMLRVVARADEPNYVITAYFDSEETMRVRIDPEADAVYIDLAEREIVNSEELADGIIIDYDAQGRIVGVEILDASRKTGDASTLQRFNLDLPRLASA